MAVTTDTGSNIDETHNIMSSERCQTLECYIVPFSLNSRKRQTESDKKWILFYIISYGQSLGGALTEQWLKFLVIVLKKFLRFSTNYLNFSQLASHFFFKYWQM